MELLYKVMDAPIVIVTVGGGGGKMGGCLVGVFCLGLEVF